MKRIILAGLAILGFTIAAAMPAHAVNVPGCFGEEFIVFAESEIVMENQSVGAHTILFGNIIVSSPTGKIKIGNNNEVHGTIAANQITLNAGAVVDKCIANVLLGPGTCLDTTEVGPGKFVPPAACTFPPLPVPVVDACVNTAQNVTIAANTSTTLQPGCFKKLSIGRGASVTLVPGGVYNVQTLQLVGDNFFGTPQGQGRANVNVQGLISTGTGNVTLRNLNLTTISNSGQAIHIFNNSLVDNSVIFAPFGNLHPHTGTQLTGPTELVANRFFDIQRITNEPDTGDVACLCPANTTQIDGTNNLICRQNP